LISGSAPVPISAGGDIPELPTFDGGGTLVDIADRDALYRAMEDG
jgi:hypothetical protein